MSPRPRNPSFAIGSYCLSACRLMARNCHPAGTTGVLHEKQRAWYNQARCGDEDIDGIQREFRGKAVAEFSMGGFSRRAPDLCFVLHVLSNANSSPNARTSDYAYGSAAALRTSPLEILPGLRHLRFEPYAFLGRLNSFFPLPQIAIAEDNVVPRRGHAGPRLQRLRRIVNTLREIAAIVIVERSLHQIFRRHHRRARRLLAPQRIRDPLRLRFHPRSLRV